MKQVILASLFFMLTLPTSDAKFTPLEIDNHPCTAENLKVIFEKSDAITYLFNGRNLSREVPDTFAHPMGQSFVKWGGNGQRLRLKI